MTKPTVQVSIRLPEELLDRADALVPALAKSLSPFRVERATVLKIAIERGLEALEAAHKVDGGGKRRGRASRRGR